MAEFCLRRRPLLSEKRKTSNGETSGRWLCIQRGVLAQASSIHEHCVIDAKLSHRCRWFSQSTRPLMPRLHHDTCRRIHVARSGYMLTVCRRHNYCLFMSRSTVCPSVSSNRRATNCMATILSPIQDIHVDGNKWIQVDTSGYNLCPATCVLV